MPVLANMIWPSLFIGARLYVWWIIAAGLLAESILLACLLRVSYPKALGYALAMNLASVALGIVLIPLSGVAWELVATFSINLIFGWGTFNPVTWLVSTLLAALVNAVIELGVLRVGFKIAWNRRHFCWLMAGNGVSVGLAMVSLTMRPPML